MLLTQDLSNPWTDQSARPSSGNSGTTPHPLLDQVSTIREGLLPPRLRQVDHVKREDQWKCHEEDVPLNLVCEPSDDQGADQRDRPGSNAKVEVANLVDLILDELELIPQVRLGVWIGGDHYPWIQRESDAAVPQLGVG